MDFSTDLNIYFPEAHATGTPSDWGPVLNSIITAMPATGGTIWLRPATYTINTQVNVSKPVRFLGHGMGDQYAISGGTRFVSTVQNLVQFYLTSGGVSFEQLVFENAATGTPTSGNAVRDMGGANHPFYGNNSEFKSGTYFRKCGFIGFYDNIHFVNSYLFGIDACHFRDQVRAAVNVNNGLLEDGGDSWISHSHFFPRQTTFPNGQEIGILQASSGGLRVTSTKFNSLWKAYQGGPGAQSTIVKFDNCSIENYRAYGLDIQASLVQVNNCQFAAYGSPIPTAAVKISGGYGVQVVGNLFRMSGSGGKAYIIESCDGVNHGMNTLSGFGAGSVDIINCTSVNV